MAFLPTTFFEQCETNYSTVLVKANSLSTSMKMSFLHRTITKTLSPLAKIALQGFERHTFNNYALRLHLLPGNYCADILESKDWTHVKHGQLTLQPCHRCHIFNSQLEFSNIGEPKTLENTQRTWYF